MWCNSLQPTADGRAAVARLGAAQHAGADAVGELIGADQLRAAEETMRRINAASRQVRGVTEPPVERPASDAV